MFWACGTRGQQSDPLWGSDCRAVPSLIARASEHLRHPWPPRGLNSPLTTELAFDPAQGARTQATLGRPAH